MSGPYVDGLGRKRKKNEATCCSSDEETGDFFSSSSTDSAPPPLTTKRRRITSSEAEVIPKFKPDERNTNVIGWLHKIDQLGEVYGWNEQDRQFVMQIRLRGSARDWYDDLDDYNLTWNQWKHALQTAFPRSTDYVDRLEEMLSRAKNDNETMTKYFHDKLSLLKKCKVYNEDAISCIVKGLPTELRANAKAYQCDTPEQLYYGYLSSLENYRRVEATATARRSMWRRGQSTQLLPKLCYACRRSGHEARECRAHLHCEVCQRSGHVAATCWFGTGTSRQQPQQTPKDNRIHAIVVDYQTIHVGSPAADFVYFLLCGTDSAFRAEHHERLVEHYYEDLCAAMQRLGVDATEAYPREVFDSELKEMLPLLVILGIFLLPIVLVDAEQAPKIDGEIGIEAFDLPSNDLFAERFSGIVEDCVRWGAI
ncbi:ecdysteroid kinase domain-containing protein [Phthorimaea operculella]|nr:ecdysteroid kinase domain-containing protein [Phthorimaea operculella]